MKCIHCGHELSLGEKFCPNCGNVQPVNVSAPEQDTYASSSDPGPAPGFSLPQSEAERFSSPEPAAPGPAKLQAYSDYRGSGAYDTGKNTAKKSKTGLIIGISAAVLAAAAALWFFLPKSSSDKSGNKPAPSTAEATLAETAAPPETTAAPEPDSSETAKRTIMIYMIGSNLESEGGYASSDLDEIMAADFGENVNIIVQAGGAATWENPSIPDGTVSRLKVTSGGLELIEEVGKVSMVKTSSLTDFVRYAEHNYPAEHYALVMWNHGGSIPIQFGVDELDPLSAGLTDVEIGEALDNAGVHFESVIFDACNMCSLEVAMALEDNADYLVAAESYVNGIGIYYTNWIACIGENASVGCQDYCEIICQDYMDSLDEYGMVGSMSVLRLSRINDVYEAYADYLSDVHYAISAGDYAAYFKARGDCGYYQNTDSVDLITLATKYPTDSATALINSVVNCVTYTESDLAYGHGITAYSPYEFYNYYTEGRVSFIELDYDNEITSFYDDFVSLTLAYAGNDAIYSYAGSWYADDTVEDTVEDGYEPGEYTLELAEVDGNTILDISDELWETIDYVEINALAELDGEYYMMGTDIQELAFDDYGNIIFQAPSAWTFLNDQLVSYFCVDDYSDDESDQWSQTGCILVTVNGEEAYLYVIYDNDHPYGSIQGYFFVEDETGNLNALEDTDMVDIVYTVINPDTGNTYEITADMEMPASELELHFYTLDDMDLTLLGYYTVYDVYGNTYETDALYF